MFPGALIASADCPLSLTAILNKASYSPPPMTINKSKTCRPVQNGSHPPVISALVGMKTGDAEPL